MKKSIKYAGIAAATLLAVAPVAAPVVSSVSETTVKADTTDVNTSNMNAYAGQFVNTTLHAPLSVDSFGNKIKLEQFNKDYLQFAPYKLDNVTYDALEKANVTATVSAVTSNGTKVSSAAELNDYLKDGTTKAVTITVTFNYNDTNNTAATPITKTFTVTKASDSKPADLTSAAISYDKTINVAYGTSAADYKLAASANLSVKDNNGTELTTNDSDNVAPAIGQEFYRTYNDAYNDTKKNVADVSKGFDEGDTTYYQVVTGRFDKGPAFATLLNNYKKTPANYGLTVNGTTATGSYNDPTSFHISPDGNSFTLVREIHVGSEEAASWTTTDTTGVVTTKSAHNYYTLKNDNNQTIANRALGANTPWRTDKVRTNANGEKQYRVATGEWIDADDVVYSNGNDNNSNNGSGLTDIKTVSGVATLTKAKGYFMALFNDEGKAYDNKYLGSPSAWRVDRTAKGADGKTYYRVATSEWLQAGEGVSFK